MKRATVTSAHALRVSALVVRDVGSLRSPAARAAIGHALATSRARHDFRIVQLATAARRLELVVEVRDRIALARGMQGFQVSAAKRLNAALRRHGTVFIDRYRVLPAGSGPR